jgi:hypothetical protein
MVSGTLLVSVLDTSSKFLPFIISADECSTSFRGHWITSNMLGKTPRSSSFVIALRSPPKRATYQAVQADHSAGSGRQAGDLVPLAG